MRPYQEEYIANLKEIAMLSAERRREDRQISFEEYAALVRERRRQAEEKAKRNMTLLREGLFPVLDHIFDADREELEQLQEFADGLLGGGEELDAGLYCQIHKALLNLARRNQCREDMIRELYRLGMGYYSLCNRLIGLELPESWRYTSQMRLCFTEAAAYLKYFEEIEDRDTRGYILRSRANMSLGIFHSPGEKIQMVRRTLQILQDKHYQETEPGLPWERYIFLTHQQMAASISYEKENTMTPQDTADVMESVYIVYQKKLQAAAEQKTKPPVRSRYSYCAIEYYCGMYGLEELLVRMERLMDEADPRDFSVDGMYGVISLPAFYCQFLSFYPELISERKDYLENLYRKVFDYLEAFPKNMENESLFLYLRQLCVTFVETEGGMPYKELLFRLQMQFAPGIYVHSRAVAGGAAAFCGILLEEEPAFFDDIDFVREIREPEEKRRRILNYALEGGMLHDVGKLNFMNLYAQAARQWFEEEYELAHLHTQAGAAWLKERKSTAPYAAAALGHHCWYDGSRGYPETYRRLECQYRQMVDIVGLTDWLDNVTDTAGLYTGIRKTFEEAAEEAAELEGRRFSPLLTARLRDREIRERLKAAFEESRTEALRQLYEWQLSAIP